MRPALASLLLVAACASSPPLSLDPIEIKIEIQSDSGANPDGNGRPSPIVVRLYQLSESGALDGAEFFQAYDDEQAVIGGAQLWRKELIVVPGTSTEVRADLATDTHVLAVVAAFRDVRNSRWKAIAPVLLDPENAQREIDYRVSLAARSVSIERVALTPE